MATTPLLVLAIVLTVGPSVSVPVVDGAAGWTVAAARLTGPAIAVDLPAGGRRLTVPRAAGDRAADTVERSAVDSSLTELTTDAGQGGCVAHAGIGAAPIPRAHRDDLAAGPAHAAADGCQLAGPKRFHGPGERRAAAESEAKSATLAAPPVPAWSGSFNLYRTGAFVTQKDFTWCVAASVQMMVNIVRHRSDRTEATQQRMITYAQAADHGPWGPGGGTDVTGWIAALRHFGAGKYRAVGARTPTAALRIAATAMRQTGRPAGMLVMEGRHAWVLNGFESRTDPKHDRRARITSVRVSGPLYPIQQKHGYDLRPNTELSVRALARFFQPSSVGALVGRYVVIVPAH